MEVFERIPQLTRLYFDSVSIDVTSDGSHYVVSLPGGGVSVEALQVSADRLDLLADGKRVVAAVSNAGAEFWVSVGGRTYALTRSAGPAR